MYYSYVYSLRVLRYKNGRNKKHYFIFVQLTIEFEWDGACTAQMKGTQALVQTVSNWRVCGRQEGVAHAPTTRSTYSGQSDIFLNSKQMRNKRRLIWSLVILV